MKKLYLSLMLLSCVCVATAQESILRIPVDKQASSKKIKKNETHYKKIEATLTSLTGYVAGTTMNIAFTLTLTNMDFEYGDSLAITFPAGFTPNSSPNDPFTTTTENQAPEALNGVSGQVISWGNNDNMYGGIEATGTYNFVVNVTIAPGVTGDAIGTFHVSGDEFQDFGPAGDFTGSFVLSTSGAPVDLEVNDITVFPYYSAPINHFPVNKFTATVTNNGGTMNTPANLIFEVVPGAFTSSAPIAAPMNSGETDTLSSSDYTPPAPGSYTLLVLANNSSDADFSDNVDTTFFEVTDSVFSFNAFDPNIANPISFIEDGTIGGVFELMKPDTLTAVPAFFLAPNIGSRVRVVVYEFGDTVGALLRQTAIYTFPDTLTQTRIFNIDPPLALPAGKFFVGIEQQDSVGMGLGFAYQNFVVNTIFIKGSTGGFFPIELAGAQYRFTPYIQAVFGTVTATGINENLAEQLYLYPNPGRGEVTVKHAGAADVNVYNHTGALVKTIRLEQDNVRIDLSDLAAGTYMVNILSADVSRTVKLNIVK